MSRSSDTSDRALVIVVAVIIWLPVVMALGLALHLADATRAAGRRLVGLGDAIEAGCRRLARFVGLLP